MLQHYVSSLLVLARRGGAFHPPGQITFGENEGGKVGEYQRRSGRSGEDKIPCPGRYRIWILQPVACTEVVETIHVDCEKDGVVHVLHSAYCYIQFEPLSCALTGPKRMSLWKIIMR